MFDKTEVKEINRAILAGLSAPCLTREENATDASLDELAALLDRADAFVANTFVAPPSEKVTRDEASVYDRKSRTVVHTLRLPGDAIMRHSFNVYTMDDYEALGLTVETYNEGRSAIVSKGLGHVLPDE